MYAQNGNTKIILRDYMTGQIIYAFNNILDSKLAAAPQEVAVRGQQFELVPFNNTGYGKLVIKPKEMNLDILSFLYNTKIEEGLTEVFFDEIVTTDDNGVGKLTTQENVVLNKVLVYEVKEDSIGSNESLVLNLNKEFTSTFKNKTVFASYSVMKNSKKLLWDAKTSKKYFKIEIVNEIESALVNSEDKIMMSIINKAYLENAVDIVDRILSGKLNDFPLVFNFLESSNEVNFQTIIF